MKHYERDLRIYAESFCAKLYHYQDYAGNEIDAVIELEDGEWCGFEIKLGASKIDEGAKNLLRIQNKVDRKAKVLCVISGLTRAAYKRGDGVYVVPITAIAPGMCLSEFQQSSTGHSDKIRMLFLIIARLP